MSKNIVLLGHGVGIKITIETLEKYPELGYKVVGVLTHPKEDHQHDLMMMEKRKMHYENYSYNVFNVIKDYNIPLLETADVNFQESIDWMKELDPEYIISFGCRNIIKIDLLNQFPKKILNVHTAPLPDYRGGAAESWMILNGEWGKVVYTCIHFIDEGIDTGNIIAKEFFKIPVFSYPIEIFKWKMDTIKDLLIKAFDRLKNPDFCGEKQKTDEATVFPRLYTPKDGRIDWDFSGEDLIKFIYAFGYPYQGASCFLGKNEFNILEAEFFSDILLHPFGRGLIFGKDSNGNYKVAVKDGNLLLKKIEVKGKGVEQKEILRLGRRLS